MISERVHRRVVQLAERALGEPVDVEVEPLVGGHSGQTLLVRCRAGVEAAVVKLGAEGRPPVGRHDVLRQAAVIEAVSGRPGVVVPRVLAREDGDPAMFAMSFEPGEAVEPVLDGDGAMAPALVEARARSAAATLAALHAVDVSTTGLATDAASSLGDEIERWHRLAHAGDASLLDGIDDLRELLESTIPPPARPAVVHGDFRLGNVLFDGPTPTAVIDWEIWSIDDPRIDLGWFLLSCDHEDFPGVGTVAPGMPTTRELIAEYASAGGDATDAPWFVGLCRFKMAAIMAHNLERHRSGRHHDPFQERLPPTIRSLVRRGLDGVQTSVGPR
jgi:streptomycin 6-kinase